MASLLINGCQITEYQFSKCATGIQETGHSRHALVNKSSCNEMDGRVSSPCTMINSSFRHYVQSDSGAPSFLTNGTRARRPECEIENSWSEASDRKALKFISMPLIRVSVFKQRRHLGDCTLPTITLDEGKFEMIKHLPNCDTVQMTTVQISIVCGRIVKELNSVPPVCVAAATTTN